MELVAAISCFFLACFVIKFSLEGHFPSQRFTFTFNNVFFGTPLIEVLFYEFCIVQDERVRLPVVGRVGHWVVAWGYVVVIVNRSYYSWKLSVEIEWLIWNEDHTEVFQHRRDVGHISDDIFRNSANPLGQSFYIYRLDYLVRWSFQPGLDNHDVDNNDMMIIIIVMRKLQWFLLTSRVKFHQVCWQVYRAVEHHHSTGHLKILESSPTMVSDAEPAAHSTLVNTCIQLDELIG